MRAPESRLAVVMPSARLTQGGHGFARRRASGTRGAEDRSDSGQRCFAFGQLACALTEQRRNRLRLPALEQLARHHHALDLVGALVDLGDRGPGGSFRRWVAC